MTEEEAGRALELEEGEVEGLMKGELTLRRTAPKGLEAGREEERADEGVEGDTTLEVLGSRAGASAGLCFTMTGALYIDMAR